MRWLMQMLCRQCGQPATVRAGRYGIDHADGCPADGVFWVRWVRGPERDSPGPAIPP